MIFDAGQQNKSLKDAGKTPIDTSPRVEKAIKESEKVTTGKQQENASVETGKRKISQSKDRKIGGKPSFEGYMSSSSALISMNDTGYLKKDLQTARYKTTKEKEFLEKKDLLFAINKPYSGQSQGILSGQRINNYSNFHSPGSSSDRLYAIIKNNNII